MKFATICSRPATLLHPQMPRPKPAWLVLALLAAGTNSPLNAQENTASYHAGFELPDYTVGSIHSQRGWSVEQGRAEVVAGAGRNASAGLVLEPLAPFSQATLLLDAPSAPASAGFLDFHVSPAATSEVKLEEMLDIDGARIGFFRNLQDQSHGRFWVFNGDGMGGGVWHPTAVSVAVDAATGRPADWIRLTMREDFVGGSWDLWVNGQLAASRAGFQEPIGEHIGSYVILGDTAERLVLDDLTIGGPNPLGMDQDRDGMLDVDEGRIGSNPEMADREELDATGQSFGEKWQALLVAGDADGAASLAPAPSFSRPSAVARESFSLTLSSSGSAAIFYTLDGSDPLPAHALTYTGPVEISGTTVVRACATGADGRASKTTAAAWVFPDQVASQTRPPGWPETLAQFDAAEGGVHLFPLSLSLRTGSTTDPPGALPTVAAVAATLEQAPIIILALPVESLFGPTGIYERSTQANLKAAGQLVWMDARIGAAGGSGAAGISISGQSSRTHAVTVKHSLRVTLPSSAEAGTVFGVASFPCTQFLLRHPTQDSWAVNTGDSQIRQGGRYLADAWASQWLSDLNRPALRHQWVHVFLNGTYWGVYDAVEQHDADYAARHPGAGAERRLLESAPELGRGAVKSIIGSSQEWTSMVAHLQTLAAGGDLTPDAAWESATLTLDSAGLIDYMLWNWWLQSGDWPAKNWLASWEEGKWRVLSWDAEMAMPDGHTDIVPVAERITQDVSGPAAVFASLSHWPVFRSMIAQRFEQLSQEGGGLTPERLVSGFAVAEAGFGNLAAAESARWGGQYAEPPVTPLDWKQAIDKVRVGYLPRRTAAMAVELSSWLTRQTEESRRNPGAEEVATDTGAGQGAGVGFPHVDWPVLDSDGDGIPDYWERLMGLDPFAPEDASVDLDSDGLSNLAEFLRRSHPRKQDVVPVIDANTPGIHNKFPVSGRRRILPARP
jgi:hypothetical protein